MSQQGGPPSLQVPIPYMAARVVVLWMGVCAVAACGLPSERFLPLMTDTDAGAGDGADAGARPKLTQRTYLKASNTGVEDELGQLVAVSADGSTLAVGAPFEDGDGDSQNNDGVQDAGAVYIFTRSGGTWTQQAYLKPRSPGPLDNFGSSLALSADGSILAVGTPGDDSDARFPDPNPDPVNNLAVDAGSVYLFMRTGSAWAQIMYVKSGDPDRGDLFGSSVALSADGWRLAVGAPGKNIQVPERIAADAGAVYEYEAVGQRWDFDADFSDLESPTPFDGEHFGTSLSFSADGATLAIGTDSVDSTDPKRSDIQIRIYTGSARQGWTKDFASPVQPVEPEGALGNCVALSADGNLLAVGAARKDGTALGSGGVYLFTRDGRIWTQQAVLEPAQPGAGDHFGDSFALSGDGKTLAVGTRFEDSQASGIDGDQADNSSVDAGAVYLFTRTGEIWEQVEYVKALFPDAEDRFGASVALSANGTTLVVGAPGEDSVGMGVDTAANNDSADDAGAAYVFE